MDIAQRDRMGPFMTRGNAAVFLPAGILILTSSLLVVLGVLTYSTLGPGPDCASERGTAYWFATLLSAGACCLAAASAASLRLRAVIAPLFALLGAALGIAIAYAIYAPHC
jgi:hypothetical protein